MKNLITLNLKSGSQEVEVSLNKNLLTNQVETTFQYNNVEWNVHFTSSYGFPIASSKYQRGLIKIEISEELKANYDVMLKEVRSENEIYNNQMAAIHY